MLQLLLGVFSGSITPVQTAVNARLGRSVGSPLRASMVSFSVGLLSMLAIVLATGPYPLLSATAADGPWWMWLAGVFGVTFLTGNVLLLPKLGSLRTVIMPVTGQIVMGLLIDAFGWFGAQQRAISPLRVCGTVLAMAGFLLAVMGAGLQLGHRDAADDAGVRRHVDPGASHDVFAMALWSLAGVSFGMCSAVQTALLGRLGVSLGSPAKASLASFVVGLAALTIVVGLVDHTYSLGDALEKGNPWWMWVGGLLGATPGDVQCISVLGNRHRYDGHAHIARAGWRRACGRPIRPVGSTSQTCTSHPIRRGDSRRNGYCSQSLVNTVAMSLHGANPFACVRSMRR